MTPHSAVPMIFARQRYSACRRQWGSKYFRFHWEPLAHPEFAVDRTQGGQPMNPSVPAAPPRTICGEAYEFSDPLPDNRIVKEFL